MSYQRTIKKKIRKIKSKIFNVQVIAKTVALPAIALYVYVKNSHSRISQLHIREKIILRFAIAYS